MFCVRIIPPAGGIGLYTVLENGIICFENFNYYVLLSFIVQLL